MPVSYNFKKSYPVWHTAATLLWGLLIAALTTAATTAGGIFYVYQHYPEVNRHNLGELVLRESHSGTQMFYSELWTLAACLLLVVAVIRLKRGSNLRDYLALKTVPVKTVLKWLAGCLLYVGLTDMAGLLMGRPLIHPFMTEVYTTSHPQWLIWLAVPVLAPLVEELFFRGFLWKGLSEGKLRPAGATFLTAAIWTSIHTQYGLYELGLVFSLGLLLGAARFQTRSLLVPVLMHALVNVVATAETAILT